MGLSAWFEGILGSLGGLRKEEGFCEGLTLRVFGGRFREDKGGFGMFLVRAIGRASKKVKREEMKGYKQNDLIEKKKTA